MFLIPVFFAFLFALTLAWIGGAVYYVSMTTGFYALTQLPAQNLFFIIMGVFLPPFFLWFVAAFFYNSLFLRRLALHQTYLIAGFNQLAERMMLRSLPPGAPPETEEPEETEDGEESPEKEEEEKPEETPEPAAPPKKKEPPPAVIALPAAPPPLEIPGLHVPADGEPQKPEETEETAEEPEEEAATLDQEKETPEDEEDAPFDWNKHRNDFLSRYLTDTASKTEKQETPKKGKK